MQRLLAISQRIDAFLGQLARLTGWLFIATMVVICFDVVTRKLGFQLPYFTSTRLQELEWHLAATLFLGWIGYGVVRDSHVRIDVFTAHLDQRRKDWIDFLGTLVFAIPYCLLILPFAIDFAWVSFKQLESSDAPNGLPARFIIKSILAFGIFTILLAAVSLLCRKYVDLFGPPELHSKAANHREVEL